MRCFLILSLGLLLAASATAGELVVPLGGLGAERSLVTKVNIVNPSRNSATVFLEIVGAVPGLDPKSTTIALGAGETLRWSDVAGPLLRSEGIAILRIVSHERLEVTALNHCPSCGATSTVPVLDARHAVEEGAVATGFQSNDPAWQNGIGIVSSDGVSALLMVTLHRGDEIAGEAQIQLPPRGMRLVRLDELFGRPATESGGWLTFSAPRPVLLFGYDANARSGASFFTPAIPATTLPRRRRRAVRSGPPAVTQKVVLTPAKDNTLYQTSDGSLSNGSGVHLFAGATGSRELRRAVMAFDIASRIPPGSRITGVVLRLQVSMTISGLQSMALHPLLRDWGEGTSDAGPSADGRGSPSRAEDATWIHTFHPDRFWTAPGGDFAGAADASTLVGGNGGASWESSVAMVARVQDWIDRPSANFGWIVIGNEASPRTAKRFDSSEVVPNATSPTLTIDFSARP